MLAILGATFALAQTPAYPAYSVVPLSGVTVPGLPPVSARLCVDQFGYLPESDKVAVLSDPKVGYNSGDHYEPPASIQVRTRLGKTVFTAPVQLWNNGKTDEISGDRGWWFDFSPLQTPGQYYLYDSKNQVRSPLFRIDRTVFRNVLNAACRVYYYQRLGVPIEAPFAEGPWVDGSAYLQDAQARSVLAKDDAGKERNMVGGWMDAGDTDKYPPFNGEVIHPLLYAYSANPSAFGDDSHIPESGNGIPDLLDEVKVQLDWLKRMQFPDGSVPVKMGNVDYNGTYPLSKDRRTRYYGPIDSGATIYTCANFAHAARVFGQFKVWKPYAEDLRARAVLAWNWYASHPRTFNTDSGEIKSGIANRSAEEQDRMEAYAAIHLFALTGQTRYQDVIKQKFGTSRQMRETIWSPYEAGASEALADYLSVPNADQAVCKRIKDQLTRSAESDHFAPPIQADLYRAWMEPTNYHWGSNSIRASWGVVVMLAAKYGNVDSATRHRLTERAENLLHSFHGVNPLSLVYLSNMGKYGAEHSIQHLYHERYGAATPFKDNPPPGYVVGGPNSAFSGKAATGAPPVDWLRLQPKAKSYADFGAGWPESSWELSEPAIYYQALYVRLLSEFVHRPGN